MPEPVDPCLEQRNALDAALTQLDEILILIQDRGEALIACEEANSGTNAGAMILIGWSITMAETSRNGIKLGRELWTCPTKK